MPRPTADEYMPYFGKYISYTTADEPLTALQEASVGLKTFLDSISEDKANYAYDSGKWTVKQFLQHAIDTERVFAYRAMAIARGEKQALPGFDENGYADTANVSHRSLQDIKDEWLQLRTSTETLCKSFTPDDLKRVGTASGHPITPNALCFILAGHQLHHIHIYEQRYAS